MGVADVAIAAALTQLGKDYVWAAADPNVGFDCSGLVYWSYKQAGVTLGRTTYEQILDGTEVPNLSNALPGDLLFPDDGHVQLYLGNNEIVESPTFGETVTRRAEWASSFSHIRRVDPAGGSVQVGGSTASNAAFSSSYGGALSAVEKLSVLLANKQFWINTVYIFLGLACIVIALLIMRGETGIKQLKQVLGVVDKVKKNGGPKASAVSAPAGGPDGSDVNGT